MFARLSGYLNRGNQFFNGISKEDKRFIKDRILHGINMSRAQLTTIGEDDDANISNALSNMWRRIANEIEDLGIPESDELTTILRQKSQFWAGLRDLDYDISFVNIENKLKELCGD